MSEASGLYLFDVEEVTLLISPAAAGVWQHMRHRMNQSPERGRLLLPNGAVPTRAEIAALLAWNVDVVSDALDELIASGVCAVGADGALECERMRRLAQRGYDRNATAEAQVAAVIDMFRTDREEAARIGTAEALERYGAECEEAARAAYAAAAAARETP